MTTLTVATFNTAGPAERLRERLENHGVPAVVRDQRTLQRFWFLAKPFAAFHLDVEKDYVDRAKGLLWDWQESKHLLAEAIRCPMCNSLRIEYPHMTRKFFLPTLFAHLANLVGLTKPSFYCQDC